jgi:hypothetical protein
MPRFGGFNIGNIGGALVRNALGTVANAVLPRSAFGGFGLPDPGSLVGQRNLVQNSQNRRVSLRPRPAAASRVYGVGLLDPIKATGGLVWPYTPTISYSHNVDYQTIQTVHANQDFHIYSKTPAVELQVSGDFSVQNQQEGEYALAAIHFLRTMAKMNFGENDPNAGTPPPILLFDAYGPFVFNDVPVIVKGFQIEFPDNVDYVQVRAAGANQTVPARTQAAPERVDTPIAPASISREPLPTGDPTTDRLNQVLESRTLVVPGVVPGVVGGSKTPQPTQSPTFYTVWLPSLFKITTSLVVQHTPNSLRKDFNLPRFRDGQNNQKSFI